MDSETGQIVGMALWDIYLTPSDWKKGEITWLQGKERERAEALVSPLWNVREKIWLNKRYLYCHVIAVHPSFQRRGIGEMLFRFGTDIAREAGLPVYIESSKDAERLYEKNGSRRLKEKPIHRSQDLWPEDNGDNGEDREVALFVWIPEGGEKTLPDSAVLA